MRLLAWSALLLLFVALAARAVDEHGQLEDPALQARYERLTSELRCLVCQNESVADSNAFLARDLRGQVQQMLTAGKSDEQILDFMTERYGEFVRYNPPLEPKTAVLWGAPFVLLAVGILVVWRIMRRRAAMPLDDEPGTPA
ncbi:MAG: cytochrome c-type biogenesis protein [Steroidobacteraceae bacterium]